METVRTHRVATVRTSLRFLLAEKTVRLTDSRPRQIFFSLPDVCFFSQWLFFSVGFVRVLSGKKGLTVLEHGLLYHLVDPKTRDAAGFLVVLPWFCFRTIDSQIGRVGIDRLLF